MTPTTRKRKAELDASAPAEETAPQISQTTPKRKKQLPMRSKDEAAEDDATPAGTGTKIIFDDNEPLGSVNLSTAAPASTAPAPEEPSEEDSDDEAPEAESTQQAAAVAKRSAQTAQKAAQGEAATQKRKRQERNALLKQQADERKAAKATTAPSSDSEDDDDSAAVQRQLLSFIEQRKSGKLSGALPTAFLTDSSSDEDEDVSVQKKPKKGSVKTIERRFGAGPGAPRDAQVGTTVYRVHKKVDERMAPSLRRYAKSQKDVLLRRDRAPAKKSAGFLKKR